MAMKAVILAARDQQCDTVFIQVRHSAEMDPLAADVLRAGEICDTSGTEM